MTDVVFKYVSWPFNQKDFRGNFIIENEHKVTKSTIAFPFNSLCESICRMRNYCARYCTSIQQIRILTILNLEGYIRRKKKIKLILTSNTQLQAYSELEKNLWHIVIFELLINKICFHPTFFLLVAKNARQSNYRREKPL